MHCERFENDARQAVAGNEHLFTVAKAEGRDDAKDDQNDSRPTQETGNAEFGRRRVAKSTGKRRDAPSVGERPPPSGEKRVTDRDRRDHKRKENNGFKHVGNRRPPGDVSANRSAEERDRARENEERETDDEEKAFFKRRRVGVGGRRNLLFGGGCVARCGGASQSNERLTTIRSGERDDGEQTSEPIPIKRIQTVVKELGVERVRFRIGRFSEERRSKSFVGNFFRRERDAERLRAFGEGTEFGGETIERRVETFGAVRSGDVAIRKRRFEERFRRGTFVNA